jgi:cytochrome c oxidase assembly protein subunit 15
VRLQLPQATSGQVRRLAVATLVANVGIVVTGGAVRLTGSGLGCPTWPRCTSGSFVPHGELGIHGAIEFGNRMLTFVLIIVAALTWLAVMRSRERMPGARLLATVVLVGIPSQGVVGGLTVLSNLNPWVVSLHLLLSMVLVGLSVVLVDRVRPRSALGPPMPAAVRLLAYGILVVASAVIYVGTIVTGSGPHAGDRFVPRNGLDPETITQAHADLVFLLIGLTVGMIVAVLVAHAGARARRAALTLLGVELAQGVVGIVQFLTDLPIVLVGLHMLGAALIVAAATWLVVATSPSPRRDRDVARFRGLGEPDQLAGEEQRVPL